MKNHPWRSACCSNNFFLLVGIYHYALLSGLTFAFRPGFIFSDPSSVGGSVVYYDDNHVRWSSHSLQDNVKKQPNNVFDWRKKKKNLPSFTLPPLSSRGNSVCDDGNYRIRKGKRDYYGTTEIPNKSSDQTVIPHSSRNAGCNDGDNEKIGQNLKIYDNGSILWHEKVKRRKCGGMIRTTQIVERVRFTLHRLFCNAAKSFSLKKRSFVFSAIVFFLGWFQPLDSSSTAAWAVSGGRLGGSFGASSSSSSSTTSVPTRTGSGSSPSNPSPTRWINNHHHHYHHHHHHSGRRPNTQIMMYRRQRQPRLLSERQKVIVTGTGVALAVCVKRAASTKTSSGRYYYTPTDKSVTSPLGPGVTVTSFTVEMDVPNRDDPNSILTKLKQIFANVKTDSRQGIQDMVSNVSLELLRKSNNIRSAEWNYDHFNQETEAQNVFHKNSLNIRRKFDTETASKFGSSSVVEEYSNDPSSSSSTTQAIITILLSIQGDSLLKKFRGRKVQSIKDVEQVVFQLSSDSQTGDCLLAAEVTWAPELRSDRLSREDVFADYPNLYPIN